MLLNILVKNLTFLETKRKRIQTTTVKNENNINLLKNH